MFHICNTLSLKPYIFKTSKFHHYILREIFTCSTTNATPGNRSLHTEQGGNKNCISPYSSSFFLVSFTWHLAHQL